MPAPAGGFYFPDDSFFIHGGTGIISNQEDNHTIVEIGYPSGKVLWQYGHPMQSGSAPGYLNQPDDAYLLKNGTITVADASNNRILFISPAGQPTGQIGNGAAAHNPPTSIDYPNGDTPLTNGDLLVSEINGSWVDEYTMAGKLVWTVHMPTVNYPSDPQQLGPNLYLMTDYDPPAEGKVLEFTRSGSTPWVYDVTAGDGMLKKPSLAERLPNGLIMVNDDYRNRVVVIDPATDSIVWQYGITDVSPAPPRGAVDPRRVRHPPGQRDHPHPPPDRLRDCACRFRRPAPGAGARRGGGAASVPSVAGVRRLARVPGRPRSGLGVQVRSGDPALDCRSAARVRRRSLRPVDLEHDHPDHQHAHHGQRPQSDLGEDALEGAPDDVAEQGVADAPGDAARARSRTGTSGSGVRSCRRVRG